MMSTSASGLARKYLPRSRSFGALLLLGLAGLLAACGGGSSSSGGGTVPPPTLKSIAVTAASASVGVGATDQLSAVGTYSDGTTQTITTTVTWTSGTASVATVASSGLATAVATGTSVITATSGTITGTATITVTAAAVATIVVTPAAPSIAAGATEQFIATATFTDSSTRILTAATTPAVAWSSGTVANATIGATTGIATGVAAGTSVITATASGVSGTTTLTVDGATLKAIAITPTAPSVISGSTRQLTILATYSDGSTASIAGTAGTWTSSATSIATIGTNTGIVTGVAAGASNGSVTSSISVTYSSMSATATLTVTPAEYAFVTNFAENTVSTFSVGAGGSLVATGTPVTAGTQPFALVPDATGHYLYVGNYNHKGAGTISEYSIGANGALTALAAPNASIATGAGPNGMAVNNGYVYVANLGDSSVTPYAIGSGGALTAGTSVVSGGGSATAGAAAVNFNTIAAGTFAYVSNFTANTVSIYKVNATTGALTVSGTDVALPSGSSGPIEVAFDSTGKYAYVVDFGSGDIAQYTVNADGSLTAFSSSAPTIALGGAPRWITINTTTNTAYVPNAGTNSVQVLSVGSTGVLTLIAAEPLAANSSGVAANPSFLALDQTGELLYVSDRGGSSTGLLAPYNNLMAQFSVSGTGALTPLSTPTVATGTTAQSEPAEIAFSLAY